MLFPGIRGEGWAPIPTGKMNSFGTGNCDPARTPQRFCARPRGPHGASLGPCAGGVGVPARAWGRAGGALECAVWVQIAQRYEIGASGWLPGGPLHAHGHSAAPGRPGSPPAHGGPTSGVTCRGGGRGGSGGACEAPTQHPGHVAVGGCNTATQCGGPRSRKMRHIFPKLGRRSSHAVFDTCTKYEKDSRDQF
jgi:hypothetical protein